MESRSGFPCWMRQRKGRSSQRPDDRPLGGLNVAVDDSVLMHEGQGISEVSDESKGLRNREHATVEALTQIFAVQPFHGQVRFRRCSLSMCDITDDSWMSQRSEDLSFAIEVFEDVL